MAKKGASSWKRLCFSQMPLLFDSHKVVYMVNDPAIQGVGSELHTIFSELQHSVSLL